MSAADHTAAFESVRIEPGEMIDGGEQVVVPVTFHVRGRDGVEATTECVQVRTVRDGEADRVCMYQEPQEALEAAGLPA